MMIEAKVIVAVPTYNRAHFLTDALTNLRSQSFDDMKVVVIDNASTDNTPSVYEEIAGSDNRFHYVRNEFTIPAQDNFKRGLQITDSKFFMWRADDDLSDFNYIESL
ncbi:MAG: glycosyltransferase family 2 protein, partial [Pseudomonadota bacterium]